MLWFSIDYYDAGIEILHFNSDTKKLKFYYII